MTHAKAPRWRSSWAAVRGQVAERQARKALEKDISTYVSEADQAELYAILERYDEAETADVRRALDRTVAVGPYVTATVRV
jgi:predicted nucleic acid-binding protein